MKEKEKLEKELENLQKQHQEASEQSLLQNTRKLKIEGAIEMVNILLQGLEEDKEKDKKK